MAQALLRVPMCLLMRRRKLKKAIEITVELGGQGYVFWGGREGYDTILNTDMAKEQDNMAYLMRMAVDYGRSIGFTGDFLYRTKAEGANKASI